MEFQQRPIQTNKHSEYREAADVLVALLLFLLRAIDR